MRLVIYLNAEGTNFEVCKSIDPFKLLTNSDAQNLHPVISQILSAKDSNEVLQTLKSLQIVAQRDLNTVTSHMFREGQQINNYHDFIINDDVNGSCIKFTLMHKHNHKYPGHRSLKGAAHRDSIAEMIKFIETPPEQQAYRLLSGAACVLL